MSTTESQAQHRCSCGRTFRHGISLKRHQKVSGCAVEESGVEVAAPIAPVRAAAKPQQAPPVQEELFCSATVVVTAEQIALWQKEKMLDASPIEASKSSGSAINWTALKETALDFGEFTVDCFHSAGRGVGSLLSLGARFTLFAGFLVALGWVMLFGISTGLSAAPSQGLDSQESARLSAESTIASFLQTSKLGQFERARGYLSTATRSTVSASDLRQMFSKLPIQETPSAISAELEQSDQVAKVTVLRGGRAEVYTLVRETQGWGLASVAVRRA